MLRRHVRNDRLSGHKGGIRNRMVWRWTLMGLMLVATVGLAAGLLVGAGTKGTEAIGQQDHLHKQPARQVQHRVFEPQLPTAADFEPRRAQSGGGVAGDGLGSCEGFCGGASDGCWCNADCCIFGDCCADAFDACGLTCCTGACAMCPLGASVIEDEPNCGGANGEPDSSYNGGCNNDPPAFVDIQLGDIVCGSVSAWTTAEGNKRDTDWYRFTINTTTHVTWEVTSDFPVSAFIFDITGGCPVTTFVFDGGESCDGTTEVSATLTPGTYAAIVAPEFGISLPCPCSYVAELTANACGICPPHATVIENEPNCGLGPDGTSSDSYNAGCHSDPPSFIDIEVGEVVCGTAATSSTTVGPYSDTDWYRFTLDETTSVRWEVFADFNVLLLLEGAACAGPIHFQSSAHGFACGEYPVVASATLPPGTYKALVMPNPFVPWIEPLPCLSSYVATLQTKEINPAGSFPGQTFQDTNTTCGAGNSYHSNCLGSFSFGQDQLYELTVTRETCLSFELSSVAGSGIAIFDTLPYAYPFIPECVASAASLASDEQLSVSLPPGTYYVLIDQHYYDGQIDHDNCGAYTLTIEECPGACCFGDSQCVEVKEAECAQGYGGEFTDLGVACSPGLNQLYEAVENLPIPNNDPAGVSSTITVPESFLVDDVRVKLEIDHTFVGDLCVELTHGDQTVSLIARPGVGAVEGDDCHLGGPFGCGEGDYDIVLDDHGTGGPIELLCQENMVSPPNYTPNEPLSSFQHMDAAGDWTLTVSDNAEGDIGTLVRWSLEFENATCPNEVGRCCFIDPSGEVGCVADIVFEACEAVGGIWEVWGQCPCPPVIGRCCFTDPDGAAQCWEGLPKSTCDSLDGDWGAWDECPCPPPTGRCCIATGTAEDLCLPETTQEYCNASGGTWELDAECPCPEPTGRCCAVVDGNSECLPDTAFSECAKLGGMFDDGEECPCPSPSTGRCCAVIEGKSECVPDTTFGACARLEGVFDVGEDCPCPVRTGRCCVKKGGKNQCHTDVSDEDCFMMGGTWALGEQCPCPDPLGSCCYLSASSELLCEENHTALSCSEVNGIWTEDGLCNPGCPGPFGRCCFDGGPYCLQLPEQICLDAAGDWLWGALCTCLCNADLTGDGSVNVFDLLILLSEWGSCWTGASCCEGDLNGDGEVNVFDLLDLLSKWG